MDLIKIGKYISMSRKLMNLTQEQLGEKLGVTSKTISRWENGNYMPDISLLLPMCEILNISVNELLKGENIDKKDYLKISDENLINYSKYLKKKEHKKFIITFILSIIVIFIFFISIILISNKTFFKNKYVSDFESNVVISIPRFTYYRGTGGMEAYFVKLKTLKQPDEVNIHIDRYLSTLEKFNCNEDVYYYNSKNDFTIFQYNINNDGIGFVNTIYIAYHDGKYCEN